VFPAPLSDDIEDGQNAGRKPQALNILYFSVFIALKRFYILILFMKKYNS